MLDRLFSWCDLCLPGNEQAFAESHRQKIQKFQVQIVQEMKRSNSARSQVRTCTAEGFGIAHEEAKPLFGTVLGLDEDKEHARRGLGRGAGMGVDRPSLFSCSV